MPYGRRNLAFTLLGFLLLLTCVPNALAEAYAWHDVKVGGGGYIPGVVFSPAERGLAYLRSDMGGAYRWDDKAKTWIPLQDASPVWNWRGVESIAPDPRDGNVVYAAAGAYRRLPAAILRSENRGDTWEIMPVAFRMGGNEEGRGLGERLAVDPNDTSLLYFGSRYDGLQKSTDRGRTWSKVDAFPLKGLGVPPESERPHAGLSFVVFDPASGAKGAPTKTIFAGNADPGEHHLYRSVDAGLTWAPVPGEPKPDLLPAQAAINAKGVLTVTYGNGMGPYGVSSGAVFKLDTKTGAWTDITPDKSYPAYAGIGLDAQKPGTLVVATLNRNGGDTIWRTTDGGATWQDIRAISKSDVSETPFLLWGNKEAGFGWWMTGLAIDPFDSGHVAYTTGATVYATGDLGKDALVWRPWTNGVEQTAIITLASPSKGPHLLTGIGDIGGYTHFDLNVSPPIQDNPIFTNSDTIDIAGRAPNVIVRSGTHQAHPAAGARSASLAYSTDYGKSWQPLFAPLPDGYTLPNPIGYNVGDDYINAAIAASADGKTFVVMTKGPVLTRDRGKHWLKIKGLGKTGRPVPDRVDAKRFYAVDFNKSIIFASKDGGASFKPLKTKGLPAGIRAAEPGATKTENPPREFPWPLMATPGKRGDLWFLAQHKLFHSTDGGKHFAAVHTDVSVEAIAFGKAPKGRKYPALFAIAAKDGLPAIWRSDDIGKNWIRVNDDKHEFGRAFRCIAADPRIFGRVYVGTDGRGAIYGEPEK